MLCSRRSGRWLTAITAAVIAGEATLPNDVLGQVPRYQTGPAYAVNPGTSGNAAQPIQTTPSQPKARPNSKTITWRAAEMNQENCVAILGEIATPGAYCLEAKYRGWSDVQVE
jgi:hypothetical protein